MRRRTGVPELREDNTTRTVHCVGDRGPAADLGVGEQSRDVVPADGVATDPRTLGDDQTGRGTLGVIALMQFRRRQVGIRCAATRQRRHDDAVGELEPARPVGPKQRLGAMSAAFEGSVHEACSLRKAARSSTASADSGNPAEM